MPSTHGAEGALNTAIIANCAILVSKLGVFLASGSSSILAEAVHSVVDIANQVRSCVVCERAYPSRLCRMDSRSRNSRHCL